MAIKDTSLLAYIELKEKGKLGGQETVILNLLKKYPNSTNKELSIYSNIPINAVSGRMNGLVKKGWAEDNGKRICSITGKLVYQWRLI